MIGVTAAMLARKGKTGVPPIVDPVPNDGGQVLVAGVVKDKPA